MRLALDVQQDIKRFLAVGGVSLALLVGTSTTAFAITPFAAAVDRDQDGLSNKIEARTTETDPRDADTDSDGIRDGEEDLDQDGVDNADELWLGTKLNDDDSDDDGTLDGDEDEDRDGVDNEDEDDKQRSADACAPGVDDDSDEDSDGDDLDDEDENDSGNDPDDSDSDGDGLEDGDEDENDNGVQDGDEDDEDENDDCDEDD